MATSASTPSRTRASWVLCICVVSPPDFVSASTRFWRSTRMIGLPFAQDLLVSFQRFLCRAVPSERCHNLLAQFPAPGRGERGTDRIANGTYAGRITSPGEVTKIFVHGRAIRRYDVTARDRRFQAGQSRRLEPAWQHMHLGGRIRGSQLFRGHVPDESNAAGIELVGCRLDQGNVVL